jgi:hypothetical protein
MLNADADHLSLILARSPAARAAELASDQNQRSNPNHTEVEMSASILAIPSKADYRVQWTEADGYTRERRFNSFRAAERYASQVETRLHMEALAETTARCGRGA